MLNLFAQLLAMTVLLNLSVSAKQVVITVGGNTTQDSTTVFQPDNVVANPGDDVLFNFTHGNHTVTQSTFAVPCIPIHLTNVTINGFDSGFRDAGNEQAITNLPVTIDSNKTIWFFDWNTCAQGGVGGINIDRNSTETLQGFQRNAERLNGTSTSSSLIATASHSAATTGSSPSPSTKPNGALETAPTTTTVLLTVSFSGLIFLWNY